MIKHADCQAAIFYDPIHHAVATVHSGWRGNVCNIYAAAIDFMGQKYRSRPEDLLVGVSPSLGPDAAEFVNYKEELPKAFWDYQPTPNHFDFWAIAHMQLTACAVLTAHIEIAGLCTHSNADDFFSFRRDHTTGRHATIAMLVSSL